MVPTTRSPVGFARHQPYQRWSWRGADNFGGKSHLIRTTTSPTTPLSTVGLCEARAASARGTTLTTTVPGGQRAPPPTTGRPNQRGARRATDARSAKMMPKRPLDCWCKWTMRETGGLRYLLVLVLSQDGRRGEAADKGTGCGGVRRSRPSRRRHRCCPKSGRTPVDSGRRLSDASGVEATSSGTRGTARSSGGWGGGDDDVAKPRLGRHRTRSTRRRDGRDR